MSWMDRAACKGLEYLFLSDDLTDVADAKKVCDRCPVFKACEDYAKQVMPTADRRKRGRQLRGAA